jgi:peptidoglycan/LPS O-acetylase OafA/YrhL
MRSLDGLRGVASLVVVIHHSLLAIPVLAAPYFGHGAVSARHPFAWIMVHTPAHLIWAGTEAVYIFFVLSGLVLVLPVLRGGFSWAAYYPSRLIRLYVPTVSVVVLAYLSILLVPRVPVAGLSEWLTDRPGTLSLGRALKDLTLVDGTSGLISPLWSLQWEVLFSILLPAFVAFALIKRDLVVVKALLLLAVVVAGVVLAKPSLFYMPMFGLGVLFALELERLRGWSVRVRPWGWGLIGVVTAVFLSAYWIGMAAGLNGLMLDLCKAVALLGAVGAVFLAAFCDACRHVLEARAFQWLGAVSFSLYLVHEPIVMAVGFIMGPGRGALVLPISVVLSLLIAQLFFRLIERPGHRFARAVSARITSARA